MHTWCHTHCPPGNTCTHTHTQWPQLIMGPLIKKNDAPCNYLPEEDAEKRGIWTKGGPLRLGGGTHRQLMEAAPSVY